MTQENCDEVERNLDITRDSELYCMIVQEVAFVVLICYIIFTAQRNRAWAKLEGRQRTVVAAMISLSLAACVVFFADNLAQIGIYLKDFQENPHLAGGVGMEIYVLCVWLVNVMLVNFYLLVAYLWQIIIRESCGQPPSRRFPVLLIVINLLQIVWMVAKYMYQLISGESGALSVFDQSYSELFCSTLAIGILMYMTYRFREHLHCIQVDYSKRRLNWRILMLVYGLLSRIAYNTYYVVSLSLSDFDSPIKVDPETCSRRNVYYGVFLLFTSFSLFMVPVYAVNSLFSPLSQSKPVPQQQRLQRESYNESLMGSAVRTSSQ